MTIDGIIRVGIIEWMKWITNHVWKKFFFLLLSSNAMVNLWLILKPFIDLWQQQQQNQNEWKNFRVRDVIDVGFKVSILVW